MQINITATKMSLGWKQNKGFFWGVEAPYNIPSTWTLETEKPTQIEKVWVKIFEFWEKGK